MTNNILTKALQPFFSKNVVEILTSDYTLNDNYPNTNIQNHCSIDHPTVDANNNHIKGTIMSDSYFNASLNLTWDKVEAIMNANLHAQIEVGTEIRVRARQKIFGHCKTIASDSVRLNLKSTGSVLLRCRLFLVYGSYLKYSGVLKFVKLKL